MSTFFGNMPKVSILCGQGQISSDRGNYLGTISDVRARSRRIDCGGVEN
jgi:hypothetical protein